MEALHLQRHPARDLDAVARRELRDAAEVVEGHDARHLCSQRIAARTGAPADRVRRVIDAIPGHLQPQADTVALLQRLKGAGHRLYYLSNMLRSYAEHLERQNAFIGDFLDDIFSARVGLMKPHRAIFELASERFALRGAPTVFIDDHAGNIAAAQAHGWQGVHFSGAAQAERELVDGGWLPAYKG